VVTQVIRRLGEVLDELVDVVVLSRAVSAPVINRPIKTVAKPIGALLRPCQKLPDLLVAEPRRHIL
jgi:hypothetical protein